MRTIVSLQQCRDGDVAYKSVTNLNKILNSYTVRASCGPGPHHHALTVRICQWKFPVPFKNSMWASGRSSKSLAWLCKKKRRGWVLKNRELKYFALVIEGRPTTAARIHLWKVAVGNDTWRDQDELLRPSASLLGHFNPGPFSSLYSDLADET